MPEAVARHIARNDAIKIKIEVDTNPPGRFETEAKILLQPIPFSVNAFKQPDLLAGKIHAILQRDWKQGRIKGRDYYDYVWYIARNTPVHLCHLEQRLRQTGGWTSKQELTKADLSHLLTEKFSQLDVELAKRDILPFICDPLKVAVWSKEFFLDTVERLQVY